MSKHRDEILGSSHYNNDLTMPQMTLSFLSFGTMMAAFWIIFYLNIYKICKLPNLREVILVSSVEIFTHFKKTILMKNKTYLIFKQT